MNIDAQDPLLGADPHVIIRQLAELKMHLELELMQRDAIVEKLYAKVKEQELELNLLRSAGKADVAERDEAMSA